MEKDMGKQRVANKAITPQQILQALQAGSITTAQAQAMFNGVMPVGDYKGIAAIFDLDLLVKQPLVDAEQKHILGILDGRLEGYDLRTLTFAIDAPAGTPLAGTLTVPAGPPWYINCVRMFVPADATAGFTVNWHCSLWTDPAAVPSEAGQPFRSAAQALLATNCPAGVVDLEQLDEFGPVSAAWLITNKVPLLG
ncbi:unnamed protein product, partial [marine sediment metagenome]